MYRIDKVQMREQRIRHRNGRVQLRQITRQAHHILRIHQPIVQPIMQRHMHSAPVERIRGRQRRSVALHIRRPAVVIRAEPTGADELREVYELLEGAARRRVAEQQRQQRLVFDAGREICAR